MKNNKSCFARGARLVLVCLLTALLALDFSPTLAQRGRGGGGSFGGGGRSSGGSFGGGGRSSGGSFGGGSSGGSRSSGGSFGGGSSSYSNGSRSSGGSFGGGSRSTGSGGSFGGSGSFGRSGYGRSTSVAPSYAGRTPVSTSSYYYGGGMVPAYHYGGWGGYSYYWGSPSWYYWTPFHPAFYYNAPVIYNGAAYPGGFNWMNFFISLLFFGFVVWLVSRLFSRRKGVRYTSY